MIFNFSKVCCLSSQPLKVTGFSGIEDINLEDHLGLVKSIVYKFDKNLNDSDLYGIACLALVEAKNSYDAKKGAFSTWATKIIKQSIFDNFRKKNKNKAKQIDNYEIIDDFKKVPFDILNVILKKDKQDSKTDSENKQILIDHYINNKTWAEIGRKKNLSKERVRQKGQEALCKIRKKYRLILEDLEFSF